jgi:serine/threonine-protein kinase
MTPAKIGKYEIVREIGKGAMGLVYEGRDPHIGRKVAIKTIRFDSLSDHASQTEMQKRFMREAQSAGNLHHPQIVTIYEVGEDQGLLYIAMEYIEGQSLAQLLSAKVKFIPEDAAALVGQVAEALDYAHRRSVIHRDVKPANILVDADGRPRLVDFGIAHLPTSTITHTGMAMGTPSYMAPEQIAGQKVDGRADVFSLGVILYELLTLEKPFPGDNMTTIIYKIVHENPRPPRELNHNLPEKLAAVVEKALAKNPAARFQTAGEFVQALSEFAAAKQAEDANRTVVFRPGAPPPAASKPRKLPVPVIGAAAALVVVAAAAVFLLTRKGGDSPPEPAGKPADAAGAVQPVLKSAETAAPGAKSSAPAVAAPKPDKTPAKTQVVPRGQGQTPAVPAPAKPEDEPSPVRALYDIKPPKLLKGVEPVYPEAARKAGIEGFVILEVTTDSRGRVANVKVLRSLKGFDEAAVAAVRQYVYEPVLVKGKPRGVIFSTTVFFKKS